MHLTKRCLSTVFLVCTLYGLHTMAATINLNNGPSSNKESPAEDDIHSRQKRQDNATQNTEESFSMSEFVRHMQHNVVDLVIVLDRSWGMGKRDFYLQEKKLARSIINQYATLHPLYTRLAVVTFAKTVEVPINDISGGNATSMTKAELFSSYDKPWERVLYRLDPEISKGTYVHLALAKGREILEAGQATNRGALPVMILITDGDYESEHDAITLAEAEELRQMNARVFTVGLGSWLSIANVRQLATVPSYYGHILDWQAGLSLPGLMTSATANTLPIWTPFPIDRQVEFCLQECTNGQCDTDAVTGITECRCSPGFYLQDQVCTECPSHTYKDTVGNEECKSCANLLGYGTQGRGAISITACECLSGDGSCLGEVCPNKECNEPHQVCSHVNAGAATCICEPGFVDNGNGVCVNEDNCRENICQNGATCLDSVNTYICVAPWGLEGRYAERRVNECSHQNYGEPLCMNYGNCSYMQFRNDFECDCPEGFEGYFCQDEVKPVPTPVPNPPPVNNTNPPDVPPATANNNKNLMIIIIAASLAGVLLIIIIIVIICCICAMRRRKLKREEEKRNAELDAQLRQKGGRYTKKSRQMPKTISQKFSGFWKKKTVRGGVFSDGDNMTSGAPSAPPKRRPDLLSSADNPEGDMHVVDEVVIGNSVIDDPRSMKGWKSYLNDLEQSGMIKSGSISNTEGEQSATTPDFIETDSEYETLSSILDKMEANVPMHIQRWEFQVLNNDGSYLEAASIGDLQEPLNVVVSKTRKFMIILISTAEVEVEKLKKEVEYISDHISSEGY